MSSGDSKSHHTQSGNMLSLCRNKQSWHDSGSGI